MCIHFYKNESEYIKYIQKSTFNGLFFTDLCHWHEYCYYPNSPILSSSTINKSDALNNSIKWLKMWDFTAPLIYIENVYD